MLDTKSKNIDKNEMILTGYPHIDKPWMKYYDKNFALQPLPKMGIYEYMMKQNSDYMDGTAITYFGNEITYGELSENISSAAKVLTALGVKKDDRILCLLPAIPEGAYLLYGAPRIGGTTDHIDPRPDSVDMNISAHKVLELAKKEKASHIIALDICYLAVLKPIEKELREMGINEITIVSPADSLNSKGKINYIDDSIKMDGLKATIYKMSKNIKLSKLIKDARKTSGIIINDYSSLVKDTRYVNPNYVPYESGHVDVIVHTSGTSSSIPKPIPLTNDNMNAYVHQTFGANMTMARGDKGLNMLPYFAAFGTVDVVHSGLCHGNNLIMIPEFTPANLGKMIMKNKPQTVIGAPAWYLNLLNDKNLDGVDLSFIKMLTAGGDKMDEDDEEKINNFLKNHNCSHLLTKGHGMSETCGCASYAINEYNLKGTMGIPLPNTIYAIVNPETKELLKFNDGDEYLEGEIIISTAAATPGVLDGNEIVPHVEYDGIDFIYTRDIAIMDRNGVLTFLARSDRSFTRFDGFKVKPYELEKLIKTAGNIKYCTLTPYFDEKMMGNMILATIVMENDDELSIDDNMDLVNKIINQCFINNPNVSSRQIPTKFRFRKELPLTSNSKIDYKSIIEEGLTGEEISVIIEETNISIGDIKIVPPQNVKQKVKKIK